MTLHSCLVGGASAPRQSLAVSPISVLLIFSLLHFSPSQEPPGFTDILAPRFCDASNNWNYITSSLLFPYSLNFPSPSPTMNEEDTRETPEESRADENQNSSSKSANQSTKDRKCQYCNQAFTSSSLGRHLDQFLFKKKPDGIHDVEEIRRIRSGITRRQARTASGKREGSPDSTQKKGSAEPHATGELSTKSREAPVRMMFNTPTWHATGVINDIPNPNPSRALEGPRVTPTQSRPTSLHLPDYAARGATPNNPDTMKALELALREVLDNIKAATYAIFARSLTEDTHLTMSCV